MNFKLSVYLIFYFSVQTHTTASNLSTFISQKKFWSETGCGRSLTKTDWSELWSGCACVRFPWEREILGRGCHLTWRGWASLNPLAVTVKYWGGFHLWPKGGGCLMPGLQWERVNKFFKLNITLP